MSDASETLRQYREMHETFVIRVVSEAEAQPENTDYALQASVLQVE